MLAHKFLSPEDIAELQGLFRQATEGDPIKWRLFNDPKFLMKGCEQFGEMRSWMNASGMSPRDSRLAYIDLVEKLTSKYNVVHPPSRAGSVMSVATAYSYVP